MLDLSGPYTLPYFMQWDAQSHVLPPKHKKQVGGTWKIERFRIFLAPWPYRETDYLFGHYQL